MGYVSSRVNVVGYVASMLWRKHRMVPWKMYEKVGVCNIEAPLGFSALFLLLIEWLCLMFVISANGKLVVWVGLDWFGFPGIPEWKGLWFLGVPRLWMPKPPETPTNFGIGCLLLLLLLLSVVVVVGVAVVAVICWFRFFVCWLLLVCCCCCSEEGWFLGNHFWIELFQYSCVVSSFVSDSALAVVPC